VGAINAAHFAAYADRDDLGVAQLVRTYGELRLRTHLRPRWPRWPGGARERHEGRTRNDDRLRREWALLDALPFEAIVRGKIPWTSLHENVRAGLVRGVLVSALRVSDGRTTTFAELFPGAQFVGSHDPRRDAAVGAITSDHVLASAALPLLFPARQIDGSYYCDGGLRFNTPMAPAIRAGADRLVVVALRAGRPAGSNGTMQYPRPVFLLGKVLDALLLDPVEYDLHVLDRLNRVLEVLERTMAPESLEQVRSVITSERGLPYRRIQTLVFRPSLDIGVLAGDYLKSRQPERRESPLARALLRRAAALGSHVEADLASYLLFDGGFAELLIALGRHDVFSRADEVSTFFNSEGSAQRPPAASE
jgi:NTE family protein